jgi:hypothetical protein
VVVEVDGGSVVDEAVVVLVALAGGGVSVSIVGTGVWLAVGVCVGTWVSDGVDVTIRTALVGVVPRAGPPRAR